MTYNSLPDHILYPSEDRNELMELANQLRLDYCPGNDNEDEIFERIVIASWMRKRYEKVRTKLYTVKHSLEAESPKLAVTMDSIKRFQAEVDQQKKQISGLRRCLRRMREGEAGVVEEMRNEYAPAA